MPSIDDTQLKYASQLQAWAASEMPDLFEGGGIVAKIIDQDADLALAEDSIAKLASNVEPTPQSLINFLATQRFRLEREGEIGYKSSQMDHVLQTRRGIPVSLALVAMCVSDRAGIRNAGVNFPGHFLIMLEHELVDPGLMSFIDFDALRRELASREMYLPEHVETCSHQQMIGRMLLNLQMLAMQYDDPVRALEFNDYFGIALPDAFQVPLARAEIWLTLRDSNAARESCDRALELTTDRLTRRIVEERIAALSHPQRPDDILN